MNQDTRANFNFNEEDSNTSPNPSFEDVSQARLSRRGWLKGAATLGVATTAMANTTLASAAKASNNTVNQLGFNAVAKSLADAVVVPEGYQFQVLYFLVFHQFYILYRHYILAVALPW